VHGRLKAGGEKKGASSGPPDNFPPDSPTQGVPGTALATGDKTVSKANKNSRPPRIAILAESHMINSAVKLTVCLTEIHVMEKNKGKGESREGPGGAGGVLCSAVSKREESGKSLRKYP